MVKSSILKKVLGRNELYLFLIIVVLSIILTSINRDFLTLENLFDLLKSYSFLGILAVGVLVVLISGGIDISFTAIASVAEYIMAIVIIKYGGNMFVAFLIASLIGTALGLVNALLIYFFDAPAIVVTIATLNIFYGLLMFISGGKWIYNFPQWFRDFTTQNVFQLTNIAGNTYGLSVLTVIWILVIILTWVILNYTTIGRKVYAMGANIEAARRAGFNIFRLNLFVYGYMGFLAGLASVVHTQIVQVVAPNSIVGRELDVLAAVVLGGASLAGGEGTLLGTILGITLIAVMGNGLILTKVSSYWHNVLIGLIIVMSISVTAYQRKIKERRAVAIEIE